MRKSRLTFLSRVLKMYHCSAQLSSRKSHLNFWVGCLYQRNLSPPMQNCPLKKRSWNCYCLHWHYPYMPYCLSNGGDMYSICNKGHVSCRKYIKIFLMLQDAITKGKPLGSKKQWTYERVDKASNEIINKAHAEYKHWKNWKRLKQACY